MKSCKCRCKHTQFEPGYRLEVMAAVAGVVSKRITELRNDDNSREVELLRAFLSGYCRPCTDNGENMGLVTVINRLVDDANMPI